MTTLALDVRPYRDADEDAVLDCLTASLGGGPAGRRTTEFFRWKHLEGPFGRSFMLVADAGGRIAGVRAFMRWRFRAGDQEYSAVRAVDTATHPDFQRRGIFSRLTLAALDALKAEGVDFVFNTPNPRSLAGYLKMGWRIVGRIPISVRVRRPIRLLRGVRSAGPPPRGRPEVEAPAAAEVLDAAGLERLLAASAGPEPRIHTVRDAAYLRWRYGRAPLLDYRAVALPGDDRLRGLAIFRVRPRGGAWKTTVSELLTDPRDRTAARELLRRVARAARVDGIACYFPPGSTARAALRRAGYLRAPGGMTFVVNPLRDRIDPDPTRLASWAVSIGDLEVF